MDIHYALQCCGSLTFWNGSGSANQYNWLTDSDPDPALIVSDSVAFITFLYKYFFILFFLKVHLQHSSKKKKVWRSHNTVEIKVFLNILLDDRRIRIQIQIRIRTNNDGSGSKTSGSTTLEGRNRNLFGKGGSIRSLISMRVERIYWKNPALFLSSSLLGGSDPPSSPFSCHRWHLHLPYLSLSHSSLNVAFFFRFSCNMIHCKCWLCQVRICGTG